MTRAIWKFDLVDDQQQIIAPADTRPLCVQVQGDTPRLWVLCSPNVERCAFSVFIFGTGHRIESDVGDYVGTVQTHDGALIWHVFFRPAFIRPLTQNVTK